jgi:hypothetical protein
MACVRPRRGAWVLDYRQHGRRVVRRFRTKGLAQAALVKLRSRRAGKLHPVVDPLVTIRDYAPRFLADCPKPKSRRARSRPIGACSRTTSFPASAG